MILHTKPTRWHDIGSTARAYRRPAGAGPPPLPGSSSLEQVAATGARPVLPKSADTPPTLPGGKGGDVSALEKVSPGEEGSAPPSAEESADGVPPGARFGALLEHRAVRMPPSHHLVSLSHLLEHRAARTN